MKKKLIYGLTALVMLVCLMGSSVTIIQAKQGNFRIMKQGARFQYVPVGSGSNCYSHQVDIYDGQQVDVKLLIQKDDSVEASLTMTNHLFNATMLQDSQGDFTISMKNTRILTADGTEIAMPEMDGWYDIKEESALTGTTVAEIILDDYTAGDLKSGYFCSTIAVSFDKTSGTESKKAKLEELADVAGLLPEDCFFEVEDNVIELIDFTLDGTMTIRGNEIYDNVILVIRGDCDITNLVIECPITVRRYAYGSLCGSDCTIGEDSSLAFDDTYNGSTFNRDNTGYKIVFDDSIAESVLLKRHDACDGGSSGRTYHVLEDCGIRSGIKAKLAGSHYRSCCDLKSIVALDTEAYGCISHGFDKEHYVCGARA